MSAVTFEKKQNGTRVLLNGVTAVIIPRPEGCEDVFEPIGEGAFRWTRRTEEPTDRMRMALRAQYKPRWFLVPSVNYFGNGWGSGAQYSGYGVDGVNWTYAWHRVAIPACTYTESERFCVSLFGDEKGGMSCSVYEDGEETVQELIWPEIEAPKVLYKRCWEPPFYGTTAPRSEFSGIVRIKSAGKIREGVKDLLDFAWKFFYREVKMIYTPERVRQLDTLYIRSLFTTTWEGLCGFSSGFNWSDAESSFVKGKKFEIGWVGQNASSACRLLKAYIDTGDEDLRDKALAVLDTWDKYAFLPNGLMLVHLVAKPDHLDSVVNGDIPVMLDSCNLGTAATYFFEAAKLCERAGIERPNYLKRAMGLADRFLKCQAESGEFAKSYFLDGSVDSPHGSVGAFMVLPLFDAYERTGDEKYLRAGLKGMDFYLGEFEETGTTTAGALDSFCIDKESAAPVLRGALRAYDLTGDKKYLDEAVDVGYYLATWQWHYSTDFPEGSEAKQVGYDTYGSTSVSAAHNALDHYGLYWVPEYLRLAELTGDKMWAQRARALWYNGTQLISDGTFVVRGRVRPAGSQDESVRHTRWGRPDHRYFVLSHLLSNWQVTFREVALDRIADRDILR